MAKDSENGGQGSGDTPTGAVQDNIKSPVRALEAAAAELWTVADFLDARPYPLPEVNAKALSEMEGVAAEMGPPVPVLGKGGLEVGGAPTEGSPTAEAPLASAGGYDYPPPFTRYNVEAIGPYTVYPYVTVGKVFFKQNGGSWVASAASIGNYAIWTAGHVVHAGDNKTTGWSDKMVFVPAYRDGAAPYGQWAVAWLATKTDWYQKGNPNGLFADMGGGVLYPNSAGQKISAVVGWLGFAWNWSKFQHWHAVGYPAGAPFTGGRMVDTQASYAYDGSVPGSPKPIVIGCDMTGGCSGGPWIWQFATGNYVNGHNSFRRTANPLELASPYFDDRAKSLKDLVVGGKP